jgi:hypothetical protein
MLQRKPSGLCSYLGHSRFEREAHRKNTSDLHLQTVRSRHETPERHSGPESSLSQMLDHFLGSPYRVCPPPPHLEDSAMATKKPE